MGLARKLLKYIERFVLARQACKFVLRQWTAPKDLAALADVMASMRLRGLLETVALERPAARRILVIAPHPDDEMIGPGGTVIKACRDGAEVTVLHLTKPMGEAGHTRMSEAADVARRFGYHVVSLDIPEGDLKADDATVESLAAVVDRVRPEAIMVPFLLDDHVEHRVASLLLAAAWTKNLLASAVEVWGYQVYSALTPNVAVDITDVAKDKADAIRMWKDSAMRQRDWAHFALGRDAFNLRFLDGAPGPRYAEAFIVLPIGEFAALCERYVNAESAGGIVLDT